MRRHTGWGLALDARARTAQPVCVPDDTALMRRAIAAARTGIAHQSGPFGALVVDAQDAVVAVAVNMVIVSADPTAHAEVLAIRRAAALRGREALPSFTLFTTCAPASCARAPSTGPISAAWSPRRARTDAEAIGFVEGPVGFDAAAFLRARGVTYDADVERNAAVALLRSYTGPIFG